jgi:DNA-directed RNA polymerase subunit H (RpoH/RPB5)
MTDSRMILRRRIEDNVFEMLRGRGYVTFTYIEEKKNLVYVEADEKNPHLVPIYYQYLQKFNIDALRDFLLYLEKNLQFLQKFNNLELLVVYRSKTNDASRDLEDLRPLCKRISSFTEDEITHSKILYDLVPLHRRATVEELAELTKRIGRKSFGKLPRLLQQDPICKYYGFYPSEIIWVSRPTEATAHSFRIVV